MDKLDANLDSQATSHATNQTPSQTPNQTDEIRFRCPCCEKLYRTHIDIFLNDKPEFDCQSCQKTFLLTNSSTAFGLFKTEVKGSHFSSCPKCTQLMPMDSNECPSCGIFIEKFQKSAKSESPTLYEINLLWEAVLENFKNDQNHQNFLNFCQKKMALSFAFQKYDDLRKSLSFDPTCEKYLKQIELRLEQQFIAQTREDVISDKRVENSKGQWIFAGIGFVGLALLIFNRIKPLFPNLTGLVVSVTLLAFGLWIFSSQKKDIKKMKF